MGVFGYRLGDSNKFLSEFMRRTENIANFVLSSQGFVL